MKDRDFISNIYLTHRELGEQAQEIFDDGGNIQDEVTQNKESESDEIKYSRELLESLTTGKSRTQLYQEAVNEQEKQKLLIKQISDMINNIEFTLEQKQTAIDQLEQDCGNMMYVIAFNTLVEKHVASPQFTHENYQQLISIDQHIQERRDQDIGEFMHMITDLVNQSTTITDPAARRDIITKMSILMILGSGINVRKMYEAELTRLKQEFAGLFFSIPPGKKGSGTKKLLHTIKKSYTSVELSADLDKKYPPLAQFVDMIDDLLESGKDKDRQKKVGREKFIELHNSIFTFQHNKVADAIDNLGDPKKNEKLLNDRSKIANHPQRMEQYFMFLYLVSCFPFLEKLKKNNFKQNHIVYRLNNNAIRYMVDNLPVNIQGHGEVFGYIFKQGIVSHSLTNTSRNRSMDILYTFDIDSMDDEVLSFVLQQGVVLCRLLSNVLPFERLVRLLPKEHILKQIQSGSFPLKEFIDVYGFYNLQANPDGMWILMSCIQSMTPEEQKNTFSNLVIDKVDDKILSFVLQHGIISFSSKKHSLPFERLVRLLPKEHILEQIQSGSFPLEKFINVYRGYDFKNHPDGEWILDNMTNNEKHQLYEYLKECYWNDYLSYSG